MGLSRGREMGSQLMHASIPITHAFLIFVFPFSSLSFSFLFYLSSFVFLLHPPSLLFTTITLYTICHGRIYHFYSLTAFDSLWVSFQDYPLAFWLHNHYHCFECVGRTTPHSQTKLLALFLTSLYFLLLSSG